jgi:3-phosphoshikimate 1-carboxyvinyltransferase
MADYGLRGAVCDDVAAALRVTEALRRGETVLDVGESALVARLFTPIARMVYRDKPVKILARGSLLRRPTESIPVPFEGGEIELDGSISSQFLTGFLMALPLAAADTTIRMSNLRSTPYIDMTLDVMDRFGIDVDHRDYEEFYVPGRQQYRPAQFEIEGDWSAASCLLVAGACSGAGRMGKHDLASAEGASRTGNPGHSEGGGVTIKNLHSVSLQADAAIIEALYRAGARIEQSNNSVTVWRRELHAFEFDATDCPDLFPALAALAACCEGTSQITGTRRLVHKESDRAEAILSEFGRLGVEIDNSEPDVMRITGAGRTGGASHTGDLDYTSAEGAGSSASADDAVICGGVMVDSHGDHRMAMALAVAALRASAPVTIRGAECVSKSYIDFWEDFEKLTGTPAAK